MFGTSDPLPEVWAAYERLREGDGEEEEDMLFRLLITILDGRMMRLMRGLR